MSSGGIKMPPEEPAASARTLAGLEIEEPVVQPKEEDLEVFRNPHSDFGPAPDGGLAAWLAVLGAWCASFCTFGWINSIGVFQSYYERDLLRGHSTSTIAWIPSLQLFFMFAMGPVIGRLYDRFGPRYLLIAGTLLHVFGLMMTSISKKYYQVLLAQGVCSAMGTFTIFMPAMSVIPTWFERKRGAAYGIVSTGSSLGGVIAPIMVNELIPKVGFGWAMRTAAFVMLALLIISNFTIRSRLPPKPTNLTKEALAKPFKDVKWCLLTTGFLLLTYGIFIPINYITLEAIESGMKPSLAVYLVPILNAASLFGRMLAGIISDRVGHYNVLVSATTLAGILVLGLWIPTHSNGANIAFSITYGFASGAYVSLANALVAKITPLPEIGYRTGMLFLVASIGGLTGSPIAGQIIADQHGSFLGTKIFAGVCIMIGSAFVLAARFHKTGLVLKANF